MQAEAAEGFEAEGAGVATAAGPALGVGVVATVGQAVVEAEVQAAAKTRRAADRMGPSLTGGGGGRKSNSFESR